MPPSTRRNATKPSSILKARGKHFSGGFDLNVFAKGSAEDQYLMVKAGAELALRLLSFPTAGGRGLPRQCLSDGGLSDHVERPSDCRRGRLSDRHERGRDRADGAAVCHRGGAAAADAGLFQPGRDDGGDVRTPARPSPPGSSTAWCRRKRWSAGAEEAATALSTLNMAAHAATKARARGAVIKTDPRMIDEDITPQYGEDRVDAAAPRPEASGVAAGLPLYEGGMTAKAAPGDLSPRQSESSGAEGRHPPGGRRPAMRR